jgi:hypothetical protein
LQARPPNFKPLDAGSLESDPGHLTQQDIET